MGLLRNASGLIIPSAAASMSGRANDPEFHIRRLQHFGSGMGIDLASVHPQFSSKKLISSEDSYDGDEDLDFNSHDEGLQLPEGHIRSARKAVSQATEYDPEVRVGAQHELDHRGPYLHRFAAGLPQVPDEDFSISGDIYKDITDPTSALPSGYLVSILNRDKKTSNFIPARTRIIHPEGDETHHDNYKDAIKSLSSRFKEFNRNRQGTSADVSDLVSRSINNPDSNRMGRMRRITPHMLGSQFLQVTHYPYQSAEGEVDHIDLKTGNWAKLDPEGYFPD